MSESKTKKMASIIRAAIRSLTYFKEGLSETHSDDCELMQRWQAGHYCTCGCGSKRREIENIIHELRQGLK